MFDGFIIDRIRRERRKEQDRRIPLHIEMPRPHEGSPRSQGGRHERPEQEAGQPERGVVEVDFTI